MTLDTSGYLALINTADTHHAACLQAFENNPGPYVLPAAILSEIAWGIEARLPTLSARRLVRDALLDDLQSGRYLLDCGEHDVPRIRQLLARYDDLELGIADSAVIACAERRGGKVLTTDRRHFPVVARGEGTIRPLPL